MADFGRPDETRKFKKGKLELVKMDGVKVRRATYEPGWRWSKSLKPHVKTERCQAPHFQYHVSGRLRIQMEDGTSRVVKAGEISMVPPGHDAWVVGKDPVVVVDF